MRIPTIFPLAAAALLLLGACTPVPDERTKNTGDAAARGTAAAGDQETPAPAADSAAPAIATEGSDSASGRGDDAEKPLGSVQKEVRDAKDAAEDATRRIVDMTRNAAAAISDAGREAVEAVREGADDDERQ